MNEDFNLENETNREATVEELKGLVDIRVVGGDPRKHDFSNEEYAGNFAVVGFNVYIGKDDHGSLDSRIKADPDNEDMIRGWVENKSVSTEGDKIILEVRLVGEPKSANLRDAVIERVKEFYNEGREQEIKFLD